MASDTSDSSKRPQESVAAPRINLAVPSRRARVSRMKTHVPRMRRAFALYVRPLVLLREFLWPAERLRRELADVRGAVDVLHRDGLKTTVFSAEVGRLRADLVALAAEVGGLVPTSPYGEPRDGTPVPREDVNPALARIADLLDGIENIWVKRVSAVIVRNTTRMLEGLAHPKEIYGGELDLYRALTHQVNELTAGQTVFAVCGAKTWDAPAVRDYFDANESAVHRGVQITRIFFGVDDRAGLGIARRQAACGINARVLSPARLTALDVDHRIPLDLGFAIFGGKSVIVHSGLGPAAHACLFECPDLATLLRSQYDAAEQLSEIPDRTEAPPQSTAKVHDISARR
jgi:hypothetical protein